MEPLERWSAYPGRPSNWLHHRALTRNRLTSIDGLSSLHSHGDSPAAPRATIAQWLNALVSSGSHVGVYLAIEEVTSTNWLKTLVNERRAVQTVLYELRGYDRVYRTARTRLRDAMAAARAKVRPESIGVVS